MTTTCDRCRADAEGGVTIRVISGQLPEPRPRLDLCGACSRKFSTWLAPVGPPAEVLDADQGDDDLGGEHG
jgi:hypothetical protein